MTTLDKIIQTQKETAEIQIYTAQLKMLTELVELAHSKGDTRQQLKEYIKQKEKEIGYE